MATNLYSVGDVVRLSGAFTSSSVAVDPSVVTVTIREPTGSRTTYTYGVGAAVVKDSVGNYHLDHTIAMAGFHWYRWLSTGVGAAASEQKFNVRKLEVLA
jgi:hypothetical protein